MTRVFNIIDSERKIIGFVVSEIIYSTLFMISGLVFDILLFSIIALFGSIFMIRYIKYLLKKVVLLDDYFLFFSDLWIEQSNMINYYRLKLSLTNKSCIFAKKAIRFSFCKGIYCYCLR